MRGPVTTNVRSSPHRHAPHPNSFVTFADLTQAELDALVQFGTEVVGYSRDKVIRHEGDPPEVFLLHSGWVASSGCFDDGSRQIVKLHFAGDLMGTASMGHAAAADTLTALTDVVVSKIGPEAIARLFRDHPRLAMILFLLAQEDSVILMERLMSIGRRRGAERLSAILLHIYDRLRLIEPDQPPSFELPLTLDQLADVLGLHAVHVSRTFRQLEQQGLIHRDHKRIDLLDLAELGKLAGFPLRRIVRNAAWLPASA